MSQQELDLRRSFQIARRHKLLVGTVAALGLLLGGGYAAVHKPMLTSTALVVLPQSNQAAQNAALSGNTGPNSYTETQEVIAESNPVLLGALPNVRPFTSLTALRREVQVASLTPYIISISAKGTTASDVEATANAVARSYISYIGSASSPVGHVSVQWLEAATSATRSSPLKQLLIYAFLGAMAGVLIGFVVALAVSRGDRRLRQRDEIANSIGVPVLASFPVDHPSDAAAWTRLLEDYQPSVVHAWLLRRVLQQLGVAEDNHSNGASYNGYRGGGSVAVLSLSSDPRSLALGPQLAVFAASQGIPTALVIGPQQQNVRAAAALRVACSSQPSPSSKRPGHLQVASDSHVDGRLDAALTVIVAVVDGQRPEMPDIMLTGATVLGVSAGAASADQLARVAMSAAADGREIIAILVADPDSADRTTGCVPQLIQPVPRRLPTRLQGIATEIRR